MASEVAHTVVMLNNGALTHFLNGDFDKAIELLRTAYTIFDTYRRQQQSTYGLVGSPLSPFLNLRPDFSPSIMPSLQFLKNGISSAANTSSSSCGATDNSRIRSRCGQFVGTTPSPSTTVLDCEVDRIVQEKSKQSLHSGRNVSTGSFSSSAPSTAHSMYNRALVLPIENQNDLSLLMRDHYRTGAIILYNLALVYHNIGVHLGLSSALPRALQLYELALESIDKGTNLMEVQKLLMAILNNCGNIYTHFHYMDETRRCFDNLRIVLAASTYDMTLDDDYNFFFLNALFQCKELCFAPAA